MADSLVMITHSGYIATVTINRPEKRNALSSQLATAIRDAMDGLRDATRVIVLTGAGEKAFIAGADVSEMSKLDAAGARRFIEHTHEACWSILSHPQPVIAAINGYCLGAGLELAMSCDIRIASDDAQLGMPEIRLGVTSVIDAALMPSLVGWAWTNELILTGENVDAHRAAHLGLVTRVVPRKQLLAEAHKLAEQMAGYSPIAVREQKALLRDWRGSDFATAIRLGVESFVRCFESGHPQEGMSAHIERREPRF